MSNDPEVAGAEEYERAKEHFARAAELTGEDRRRYLDEAFAGDPAGRARVERVLEAAEGDSLFLEPGQAAEAAGLGPRSFPERIGPYRILGVLGSGGMGIVFRAEQQRPQREVALKVLRSALVDASILRRFEHEVEVLGRLAHPGIARVYEAGTAEVGGVSQPWFALELVEGAPLVDFAAREKLPLDRRIELLADVCDAVEHAHRKAVVHRDLKPGNVLVDGSGQVKVLDFGIARVMDAEARSSTLRTASGVVIGTLAYMSPEQARGDQAIDLRTDVYSLGVMAYELFSGRLPYDLGHLSFQAALREVVEHDPLRLGTHAPSLRGDLEVIVGHALEKEPARRYPSAAALAADLRRHLRDEPIEARPPSSFYQLRKFARRNRTLVAGVVSTFVVLIVGLAVSLDQYRRADAARTLADERANDATRQAAKALNLNEFVLQDMLAAPDPWSEAGDIRVSEVLDRASARVEERFAGEPELEAAVRATLGGSYMARGLYGKAEPHLVRALALYRERFPDGDPELARALRQLCTLQSYLDEGDRGVALGREAVAMNKRLADGSPAEITDALLALGRALVRTADYDEARAVLLECLELQEAMHDGPHAAVLNVVGELGGVEHYAQNFEAAIEYQQRALELARAVHGPTSPFVGVALNDLAQTEMALRTEASRASAVGRMREGVALLEDTLGPEHAVTIRTRRNLGIALGQVGQDEEAEATLLDAYDLSVRVLGERHVDSLQSGNAIAHFLMARERNDEALERLDHLVPIAIDVLGPDHPDALTLLFNRAWLLRKVGRVDESLDAFRTAQEGLQHLFGPAAWRSLLAQKDTVTLLIQLGQLEEASERLAELGAQHDVLIEEAQRSIAIDTAEAANQLGGALSESDPAAAAEALAIGHALCVGLWSPEDWRAADTASKLGECLARSGRAAEAEAHLTLAVEALEAAEGAPAALLPAARTRLEAFRQLRAAGQ